MSAVVYWCREAKSWRCTLWVGTWLGVAMFLAGVALADAIETTDVTTWEAATDRHWPGPALWANRLQDWSVEDGVLLCVGDSYGGWHWRTAHLLTHDLAEAGGTFRVELDLERGAAGQAGLLIGGGEGGLNYKQASQIQGQPGTGGGFLIAWDFQANALRILDFGEKTDSVELTPLLDHRVVKPMGANQTNLATLAVEGRAGGDGRFALKAQIIDDGEVLAESTGSVDAGRLVGNIAIASLNAPAHKPDRFRRLRVGGERVAEHPERAFGPIAGVLYSVANGDLKVGVQCVSLGQTLAPADKKTGRRLSRLAVRLEEEDDAGQWQPVSPPTGVSEPSYYALIRLRDYDHSRARKFRVVMNGLAGVDATYAFSVPAEPKGELVVGGVSCTGAMGRRSDLPDKIFSGGFNVGRWTPANVWAPWEGVSEPLIERRPDIVFFTGDQLYEYNPTARDPLDAYPTDDYLYKWLIWHWAFGEVTRRVPCVLQTDDHDVWHPNLWGDGGRLMTEGGDSGGGYLMSTDFVNLVQRTMCGHNPDPFDAGPLDSGVTNYFTTFTYGDVDFAILEDRKFKTAANGQWRQAGADQLLGDTQIQMLDAWANAEDPAPARVVVSQTNYAKVFTDVKTGVIGKELDPNGWPKAGRDRAVQLFEDAGAILFTGDQHLSSVVRLETQDGPGVLQFCQPAGGCIWWRSFYPAETERQEVNTTPGAPSYLGHFVDGFGNPFEVLAVANPGPVETVQRHLNPQKHALTPEEFAQGIGTTRRVHAGEGFSVLHIQPDANRMTLECWPLAADVTGGASTMFPGWPITLRLSTLETIP